MATINKSFNLDSLKFQKEKIECIIDSYTNQYMSIATIAQRMNLSRETVRNVLLANNVIMRKKNNKESK